MLDRKVVYFWLCIPQRGREQAASKQRLECVEVGIEFGHKTTRIVSTQVWEDYLYW